MRQFFIVLSYDNYSNNTNIIMKLNKINTITGDYPLLIAISYNNKDMVESLINYAKRNNINLIIGEKDIEKIIYYKSSKKIIDSISNIDQEILKILKINRNKINIIFNKDNKNNGLLKRFNEVADDKNSSNNFKDHSDPKENDETLIIESCKNNDIEKVKNIIGKTFNINKKYGNGKTLLLIACQYGSKDIIKYLIENGSDVNIKDDDGNNPLILYCQCKDVDFDIVELLIDKGIDLFAENNLGEAVQDCCTLELHKKIVKKINNSRKDNDTQLTYECKKGNLNEVKKLIDFFSLGIRKPIEEINEKNNDGDTALIIACKNNNMELIEYIIENGGDVNMESDYGLTPLLIACYLNYEEEVKYLVNKKNADQEKSDNNNNSPLNVSIYLENENIVKLLKEKIVSENNMNKYSITEFENGKSSNNIKIKKYFKW